MSVLLFLNLKGGVAKTTNAVAVAETLAEAGNRVLVIDADHQCAAGELLLGETRLLRSERRRTTLHDLLAAMMHGDFSASQFDTFVEWGASNIRGGIPHLGVLPCSLRIDDFSTNRAKAAKEYRSIEEFYAIAKKRERVLRTWLLNSFDYVIVDCPPSIPLQVRILLKVADAFVVPSVPDRLSVRGSYHLIERIRRTGLKKVIPLGTLWTLYKGNNVIHRRVVTRARQSSSSNNVLPRPFKTVIPNATAIARASEVGGQPKSISSKYEPAFSRLFQELVGEIQDRLEDVSESKGLVIEQRKVALR